MSYRHFSNCADRATSTTAIRGLSLLAAVCTACVSVASGSLPATAANPKYSVTELVPPSGESNVTPISMNDSGNVVGSLYNGISTSPFLWVRRASKFVLLGHPAGTTSSYVTGINDAGIISGYATDSKYQTHPYAITVANLPAAPSRPAITPVVKWLALPGPTHTQPYANTWGIDPGNNIVGSICLNTVCGTYVAALWKFSGNAKSLSTSDWKLVENPLPKGASNSVAYASVSNPILKAGYVLDSNSDGHPALWNDAGKTGRIVYPTSVAPYPAAPRPGVPLKGKHHRDKVTKKLKTMTYDKKHYVCALNQNQFDYMPSGVEDDISSINGKVIVVVIIVTYPTANMPTIDDLTAIGNSFVGVGQNASHASTFSFAMGVAHNVGVTRDGGPRQATGAIFDLNKGITDKTWQLTSAMAVNSAGLIAGTGLHNGTPAAFLLTPTK